MVLRTHIASTSASPAANRSSRLILGYAVRAASLACNVGTLTVVMIWWRLAVRQFEHLMVPHVPSPFNEKERSSQGEGVIPIQGMYINTK